MANILGENLLVEEDIYGRFLFTIENDVQLFMSSYEMAKLMYLLRSYVYGKAIDKVINKYISLQEIYELDGNTYNAIIWISPNDDGVTINVHYTMTDGGEAEEDDNLEDSISIDIPSDRARQLISDYIDLEYQKTLTDD